MACGVLLVALGVPILTASLNVVEYRVPYAFEGPFAGKDAQARQELLQGAASNDGVVYDVNVTVDKRMEPPVRGAGGLGESNSGTWVLLAPACT